MIDIGCLRAEPQRFAQGWRDQNVTVDVDALLALDADVRQLKHASETARAEAKAASKQIGAAAKAGGDIAAAREQARQLGDEAKQLDQQRQDKESALHLALLELPNICDDAVPVGGDESANVTRRSWGTPPELPCAAEPHWDIATRLEIIDFERGAQLSGSGFVIYRGLGARLQRALISYFLDHLVSEHAYLEHQLPLLVRGEALRGTGNLPKFADQLYHVTADELYSIPTAEVPLTNLHANEILEASQLPLRYCAHTACFRREAGAAGIGTRGIQRVHQFDKVEMVQIVEPEHSAETLEQMVGVAEGLLQSLDLHYRVLELCTADTSFSSARTYDLEIWSPGTGSWLEVSSISNCTDFQARRIPLRYRPQAKGKPALVHTLNGSALALPRVVIGLLERYLQADGSVLVPPVLRAYMGGVERITAPGADA